MSSPRLTLPVFFAALVLALPLLTGGCAAPIAVAAVSYGADAASLVATGKSTSDHLGSIVMKQDCAVWRIVRGRAICRDREGGHDPYETSYSDPYRQPAEDGVAYGPPLRPAADAPAASWDIAAYTPAPSSTPAPTPTPTPTAEPVTQVAEVTPLAEPPAVPPQPSEAPAPAKAKKPKKVAKKKPSPNQVVASR